jgi:FtsP/CotA-like multicopper oxidase with cupredoxin domain
MHLSRRNFLAGAAVLPIFPRPALAAGNSRILRAAETQTQIAPPGYPETRVWTFNGQVPGESLRYRQGETLTAVLDNALDEPTTIHWHGLRLPNAMDGAPEMTQAAVAPGERFTYQFALPDAGTFWYHPHANSVEQISRGLAGVLVVEEPDRPDIDHDETIVLDDWRLTEDAQIHNSFGNRHDLSHAGRIGNYITANGSDNLRFVVRPGDRLRLRLVNTATARVFRLRLKGLRGWLAALDGMPLGSIAETDEVILAPAQRADLFVDVTAADGEEAYVASVERDDAYVMSTFAVGGQARSLRPAPSALPPNPMPDLSLADARSVPMHMEGGAMRGMEGATWKGARMDMRQLVQAGQFWAFNGMAGMSEEPFIEAALGEVIRVPMTNRTAFPHAMHLHGMHFREVLADGHLGPWRDTLLVSPDQPREIAFVAENPGDWMFHCHMLSHQKSGMMTWVRVTG